MTAQKDTPGSCASGKMAIDNVRESSGQFPSLISSIDECQPDAKPLVECKNIEQEGKVELLYLSQIILEDAVQPRLKTDTTLVKEYAELMQNGNKLPHPVVFYVDGRYILADGFHRYHAAKKLKWTKMSCRVHQGTMREAIIFSAMANATHGARLTKADKRRVAKRFIADPEWNQWSNVKIAQICGLSESLVRSVRDASSFKTKIPDERTVERGDTTYRMMTDKIGKGEKSSKLAQTVDTITPSSREIASPDITFNAQLKGLPNSISMFDIQKPSVSCVNDPATKRTSIASDEATQFSSSTRSTSFDLTTREQIADGFVQKCLYKPEQITLDRIIEQGHATTYLSALKFLIKWADDSNG